MRINNSKRLDEFLYYLPFKNIVYEIIRNFNYFNIYINIYGFSFSYFCLNNRSYFFYFRWREFLLNKKDIYL